MNKPTFYKIQSILIWIFVFSLFNDIIGVTIGPSIKVYQIITIFYIPYLVKELKQDRQLHYILKYIILEWKYLLVLAVIFGILFPWQYNDSYRSFTQKAFGRSIISSFRIFIEILSVIVPYFWLKYNIISAKKLLKIIAHVIIVTFLLAIIDFIIGYKIKLFINSSLRALEGRFTGLNGEPRNFGKVMLFGNIIMFYAKKIYKNNIFKYVYLLTFIGILISTSASTLISLIVVVIPIQLYFFNSRKYLFITLMFIPLLFLKVNDIKNLLNVHTLIKIEKVMGNTPKSVNVNGYFLRSEPLVFKSFEVFDRAALNFLWNNPKYIFFGTGPNLISIPSSEWIDPLSESTYKGVINSVPHSFIINTVSRSGVIGVVLFILFFYRFKMLLKNKKFNREREIFFKIFFVNILVASSLFYFTLGLIIYLYVNNSNSNTKLGRVYRKKY